MTIASPAEVVEGFRLSPLQRRLWKEQSTGKVLSARCMITVSGPVDRALLERALGTVLARHEILRTVFRQVPGMGMPVQVVDEPVPFAMQCGDEMPSEMSPEQVLAVLREQTRRGSPTFGMGPLVRAWLAATGDNRHTLVLELPALVADLHSIPILFEDLVRAYSGEIESGTGHDELPYLEYSEWHNDALESAERAQGEEYWRGVLRGVASNPDHEAEEGGPTLGDSVLLKVDGCTAAKFRECALAQGWGLDLLLLGGLFALGFRLSPETASAISVLSSGRKFQEFARSIGPFGGFLPLRVNPDEEMAFGELVRAVQSELERAEQWEEFYYSQSLDNLVFSERPTHAFDFVALPEPLTACGATFALLDLDLDAGPFAMQVSVRSFGERLVIRARHDFSRFCAPAVERRLDHLVALVVDGASALRTPLGRLNMLDEKWRRRVVFDWNRTATERPAPAALPVHQRFQAQAAATPHASAVTYLDQALSFAELDRRATRIARWLIRNGVAAEVPVGLLFERSLDMIAAVLGVWKAGGCYVPLDASQPDARLAQILKTVDPPIVLTQPHLVSRLGGSAARAVILDALVDALDRESDASPEVAIHADQLAYIIFTSGSTGEPKGVGVSHGALANLRDALVETVYAGFGPGSNVGLNAPLTFDASVKQLLQVTCGCTICLIPEELRRDGPALLEYLRAQRVDALDLTPSHLRLLMADEDAWQRRTGCQLLLGGESLDQRLWTELSSIPGLVGFNIYGPTECTDVATTARIASPGCPTIGRPLPNLRVYILDEAHQPVPPGAMGEIYIGGQGVARGYHRRPSWTAERFLPDPFAEASGARMYRTGDLGRFRSDGRIVFCGRNDRQIKVRGFRVELGEIEAALRQHPEVKEAAVSLHASESGDRQIAAYVVPQTRAIAEGSGYRLPNGMVIAHNNKNETDYLYKEIFEKHTYTQHGVQLFDRMCVFDVGANIGMFSLYVKQACPNARIHAFEPIPPIHETLRRNLSRFASSVTLHRFGLFGRETTERFTFYPRYTMMSGATRWARPEDEVKVINQYLSRELELTRDESRAALLEHADELLRGRFDAEEYECLLRPLSAVIREQSIDRIDLLKIDVQRSELEVLAGIDAEHWSIIQQVVMEVHDASGQESAGRIGLITSLLEAHGFRVVVEQDPLLKDTDRYNLYAGRPNFNPARADSAANGESTAQGGLTAKEVTDHLITLLPDFMIPSSITFLSDLPLNRSGKVDYGALPQPRLSPRRDHARSQEFVDLREEVLARVWGATLGVDDVGPEDNFFELGGDSIRSIQVQTGAKKQGIHFTLQQLFRHQTIRALVENLEAQPDAHQEPAPSRPFGLIPADDRRLMPADVIDAFPLAQIQAGMHYHTELRGSGATYHVLTSVDLRCALDPDRMRDALVRLAEAHPILRSSFHLIEFSRPLQLVHKEIFRDPLTIFDLRGEPSDAQEARIAGFVEGQQKRPFDFARGLLFHVYIFHLTDSSFLLVFEHYHGLLDGLSVHLAIAELVHHYAQLMGFTDLPAPPPPRTTYRDFVALEQQALESRPPLDFWLNSFRGVELQRIPRQLPAPDVLAREMRTLAVRLPAGLSAALRDQARSHNLPLKSLLLAAHLRVMGLVTGTTAPLTGLVVNVRPETEDGERVLGVFLNTLPIQVPLVTGTWLELARSAFDHENALLDYRRVPLPEIIRRLGGRPLFETFFNYAHFPHAGESFKTPLRPHRREAATVDIDFTLSVDFELEEDTGRILLSLIYDVDQLCERQIRRMADYLCRALDELAYRPDSRWDLGFPADGEEYARLARDWAAGPTLPAAAKSALEMIESAATRAPAAIAVRCGGRSVNYGDLDLRANRLAHHLRARGVGPEDWVGVAMDRDEELIVCLLAIWKAGAAYVPLDHRDPPSRRELLLSDSRVKLLVSRRENLDFSLPATTPVFFIDQAAEEIASQPCGPVGIKRHPRQSAYVLYTSGSTGPPKPVVIPQSAVANLLDWSSQEFCQEEFSGTLAATPLSFDLSVFEIFAPLATGATVILAEDLFALPRLPERSCVSLVNTVPSLMAEALRLDLLPPQVRSLNLAGEPLSRGLLTNLFARPAVQTVRNLYGPTEATVYATCQRIRREEHGPISIGRPIGGVRAYVVDDNLRLVPEGEPGELLLGGAGLAIGYGSDARMTSERFVPDPFSMIPGQRLYRTGDIVRWSADGMLEFLGRQDRQVKIRGCRVELGEIEACLRDHPLVRDCVVRAFKDASSNSRLVAYVAPGSKGLSEAELIRHLSLRLNPSICPDEVIVVQEWPLLPSGKVDASALPAPASQREAKSIVAPVDAVEEEVREIWSQVLGLAPGEISTDRLFAELGGYSLLATRLVGTVRDRFQVELPLCVFSENPTVRGLALSIRSARNGDVSRS
jgi:amino acid adenylation domain-containing protein/FkbM family methyltransferase